jgi:hypothetical protein
MVFFRVPDLGIPDPKPIFLIGSHGTVVVLLSAEMLVLTHLNTLFHWLLFRHHGVCLGLLFSGLPFEKFCGSKSMIPFIQTNFFLSTVVRSAPF